MNQINMPPPTQQFIGSNQFINFKSIEEIKEKIKTFMMETTHSNGFEDWSQRGDIHHIQVHKYILEVTGEPDLFTVSIYTDTMTIRYGGSLWNNYEACLRELSDYLYEEYNLNEYENSMKDDLHKYESILQDMIVMDEVFVSFETYEQAKDALFHVICDKDDIVIELQDSFLITQQNCRYCFVLDSMMNDPTLFKLYIYADKDEVATKYMKRKLEECVDFMLADTEEEMIKYHEDCDREEEQDNRYTKKALCVACGEVNYAEPVNTKMVCCDCVSSIRHCGGCAVITLDNIYYNRDQNEQLCFDCHFKKPVREQIPLNAHLQIRRKIQSLASRHFDILVDYASLCEFTIFDAYRYKSRCHYRDCKRVLEPHGWCSEEATAFCCRRHAENADEIGCHCQNICDGVDSDDDYAEYTCKVCNSSHEANVKSRVALRNSGNSDGPVVSAICAFEELCMSNVLGESLVDLCEYI
jgi:hypothetical protein